MPRKKALLVIIMLSSIIKMQKMYSQDISNETSTLIGNWFQLNNVGFFDTNASRYYKFLPLRNDHLR